MRSLNAAGDSATAFAAARKLLWVAAASKQRSDSRSGRGEAMARVYPLQAELASAIA
jgi:hypothetical protein